MCVCVWLVTLAMVASACGTGSHTTVVDSAMTLKYKKWAEIEEVQPTCGLSPWTLYRLTPCH